MYPSGKWEGFWVQELWGRQSMRAFELHFRNGEITGGGRDVVGTFTFAGQCDPHTGRVVMVKQYHLKHRVMYDGMPDGEGSIVGTWSIGPDWTGSFLLRPVVAKPTADAPIRDLG
jgi:hypothetical protein